MPEACGSCLEDNLRARAAQFAKTVQNLKKRHDSSSRYNWKETCIFSLYWNERVWSLSKLRWPLLSVNQSTLPIFCSMCSLLRGFYQTCLRFPACISLKFLRLQISKADFPFLSAGLHENVITKDLTYHIIHITVDSVLCRSSHLSLGQKECQLWNKGKPKQVEQVEQVEWQQVRRAYRNLVFAHWLDQTLLWLNILKHVASLREWLHVLCHALFDWEIPNMSLEHVLPAQICGPALFHRHNYVIQQPQDITMPW